VVDENLIVIRLFLVINFNSKVEQFVVKFRHFVLCYVTLNLPHEDLRLNCRIHCRPKSSGFDQLAPGMKVPVLVRVAATIRMQYWLIHPHLFVARNSNQNSIRHPPRSRWRRLQNWLKSGNASAMALKSRYSRRSFQGDGEVVEADVDVGVVGVVVAWKLGG
jgi:hypothetical protein